MLTVEDKTFFAKYREVEVELNKRVESGELFVWSPNTTVSLTEQKEEVVSK